MKYFTPALPLTLGSLTDTHAQKLKLTLITGTSLMQHGNMTYA